MWTALVAAVLSVAIFALAARRCGPRFALGAIALGALLVPIWLEIQVGDMAIDLRTLVTLVGGVCYCAHPQATASFKLVVSDYAMIVLVAMHIVSDTVNDGFSLATPLRTAGEWALPYIIGRWAIQSAEDIKRLAPVAAACGLLLAGWGVFEAVFRVNPAHWLVSERPADMFPRVAMRWGLKRAEGPMRHPIYLGMVLAMLAPWSLSAARHLTRRWDWRRAVLPALLAGIIATGSRTPLVVAVAIAWSASFCACRGGEFPWELPRR